MQRLKNKKIIAYIITLCLVVGGIMVPVGNADASDGMKLSISTYGNNDNNVQYAIYVKPSTGAISKESVVVKASSKEILIDGVVVSDGINEWGTAGESYLMCIKYQKLDDGVTAAANVGNHYITIPAGSIIAGGKLSEDFNFMISGTLVQAITATAATLQSEKGGVHSTNKWYIIGIAPKDGRTLSSDISKGSKGILVDGVEHASGIAQWVDYSDYGYYAACIKFSEITASAETASEVGTHCITFPAGTYVGNLYLSEDLHVYVSGTRQPFMTETTVSLGLGATQDGTNNRYLFYLKPVDDREICQNYGSVSATIYLDDNELEAIWADKGTNGYALALTYDVIETGAGKASDIGKHIIRIPKGTCVGDVYLAEEFVIYIDGAKIGTPSKVEYAEGGTQDNENNRYLFWLEPTDGRSITSVDNVKTVVLVDGVKKDAVWACSGTSSYALGVPYSVVHTEATTKATDIGKHTITVPAGTIVGDMAFEEDFVIFVEGSKITIPVPVTLGSTSGAQDNNGGRYVLWLVPPATTEVEDSVTSRSDTVYVDGQPVSGSAYFSRKGDATVTDDAYGIGVYYDSITSGATSYSQIGKHCIMIPSGTYINDMTLLNDMYIMIDGSSVKEATSFITLDYKSNTADTDGYKICLQVTGAETGLKNITDVVYVDGGKKQVTYTAMNDDSGSFWTITIPYNTLKTGATSGTDITHPYVVTIPKGVVLDGHVLTEGMTLAIKGSDVTEVLDTDATVMLSVASVASESQSLALTASTTDGLTNGGYSFTTGGIYVGGEINGNLVMKKSGDAAYAVEFSSGEIKDGTVVIIEGTIQSGEYCVAYERKAFRYTEANGWEDYVEPVYETVTLSNDFINGGENQTGIYMNATSDLLANQTYTFAEGGVSVNGTLNKSAVFEKVGAGYYYIDLSSITLKAGDIVTLSGTVQKENYHVTYESVSYKRNKDGSFTQYDENAQSVAAETVELPAVYVNLDADGSYTIPSTPLVTGNDVTVRVNGITTTEYVLDTVGTYNVERVMENTILTGIYSSIGDITYTQTVNLYTTGDVNGKDGLTVADLVSLKKKAGSSFTGGAADLDYNQEITADDVVLLRELLVGKKTAEEIYSEDESVVVGLISDLHYKEDGRDGQNRINTRKALNYYKSQNADVIIFNGDVSDLGGAASYANLVKDIKSVYPDGEKRPTMLFTGDNHEWYDVWTANNHTPVEGETWYTLQKRFCEALSEVRYGERTDANSCAKVNGYYFIGISSDGMDGAHSAYDTDTVNYLKEKLAEAKTADSTKPIFVAIHQAPPETVAGSEASTTNSVALYELLGDYPQAVVITSHTHRAVTDEQSISQDAGYTVLNTGSLYYAGGESTKENVGVSYFQFAQGLLARVNGSRVDIERCDFWNDEVIGENWTFTASEEKDSLTYTRSRSGSSVAPVFAENAVADVTWTSDTTANISFTAATDNEFVRYYEVRVYKDEAATPSTYRYSSFYYLGLKQMPDTMNVTVKKLNAASSYRFEIVAVDSWENSSTALKATFVSTMEPNALSCIK